VRTGHLERNDRVESFAGLMEMIFVAGADTSKKELDPSLVGRQTGACVTESGGYQLAACNRQSAA
jgi:hypothetical protein